MSGLGQYVHYTWSGYENYGTYIDKTNWRGDYKYKEKSDYEGTKPFDVFSNFIQTRANNIKKYDIQTLEEQYNNLRKKQFEDFKKLQNEKPEEFLILMKRVVENANIGKNFPIEQLAKALVLDDERKTVMPKYLEALGEHQGIKKIRQLAKDDQGNKTSYLETVRQAYLTAKEIVDNSPSQEALSPELKILQDRIQRLEDIITANPSKYSKFSVIKKVGKNSRFGKEGAYKTIIPRSTARYFISQLLSIAKAADISNMLAKLEGSLTEIMGASLRPMVKQLAVDEIGEIFGSVTSAPQIGNVPGVHLYLDQKTMEKAFEKQKGNTKTEVITKLGDGAQFTFKTDYETQNKKDFVLEWQGRELSVSAKAYDLSVIDIYDKRTKKTIPNFISLQSGTSLLVYLLNLEQQNFYSSLGTHFLNVFAQHGNPDTHTIEKEGGDYARVRKVAQDALTLGLLYNSLTGDLSGKEQDTFADILMIEDKSKQIEPGVYRVKFYNISTIINHIMNNINAAGDKLYIYPNLDTLTLDNTWGNRSSKERITKLLLDARQQKFKVGLNIRNLADFR